MSYLENRSLKFIINGEKVELESISKETFDRKWTEAHEYGDIDTDRDFFDYLVVVKIAISKLIGYPVSVTHQSAMVAYEAWDENDGTFIDQFTVYSDYIDMHSFDAVAYNRLLKEIS